MGKRRLFPNPPTSSLPIATGGSQTLATQFQSVGNFQLADDQAIVITVNPGRAGYFVVPVTNDWAITGDYWNQQTSLNNGQATANADGSYTIVISPTDPGVENWVSTAGVNQGTIFLRFQALGEATTVTDPVTGQTVVTNNPSFITEVMTLDELHTVMPPTFTPAQREAQLAKRKAGYDARYAPFSQL